MTTEGCIWVVAGSPWEDVLPRALPPAQDWKLFQSCVALQREDPAQCGLLLLDPGLPLEAAVEARLMPLLEARAIWLLGAIEPDQYVLGAIERWLMLGVETVLEYPPDPKQLAARLAAFKRRSGTALEMRIQLAAPAVIGAAAPRLMLQFARTLSTLAQRAEGGLRAEDVGAALSLLVHEHTPAALCSLMRMGEGQLHLVAAPQLPPEYVAGLLRLDVHAAAGSCGTAAHLCQPIYVEDIERDPRWAEARVLALQHGLRACWSVPLISLDNVVVGTFALYFREPRAPLPVECEQLEALVHIAGVSLGTAGGRPESVWGAPSPPERDREREVLAVIDASRDLIVELDLGGRIERVNAASDAVLGFHPEHLVGMLLSDLAAAGDSRAVQPLIERLSGGAWTGACEQRCRHANGSSVVLSWSLRRSAARGVIVGIARDHTGEERTAEALFLSEAALHNALRLASLGNWDLDIESGQLRWSEETRALYQAAEAPMSAGSVGLELVHAVHPDDRRRVQAYYEGLQVGDPGEGIEYRILRSDGAVRWLMQRGEAVRDPRGEVYRILGVVQDITPFKARQRQAERLNTLHQFGIDLSAELNKAVSIRRALHRVASLAQLTGLFSHVDLLSPDEVPGVEAAPASALALATPHLDLLLQIDDRAMAVLRLRTTEEGGFSAEEIQLLSALARSVGLGLAAIERAQQREAAREALRASEQRFQRVFISAPTGIAVCTQRGEVLLVNPAFCTMAGRSESELQEGPFWALVDAGERKPLVRAISRLRHGKTELEMLECRLTRPDGTQRWIRAHVSLLGHAPRRECPVVAVVEDFTRRREAEQRLRVSQSLVNIAGHAAKLGGWSLRVDNAQLSWSDETCAIHEVEAGTVRSLDAALAFCSAEWRMQLLSAFSRCSSEGRSFDIEVPCVTAKGRKIWVRVIGQAERRDSDDRIVRIEGAYQDVTERRLAHEQLQDLAVRLHRALEYIADAFVTLDRDWRFTYVNREAEGIFGASREELIGAHLWSFFPPSADPGSLERLLRSMHEQAPLVLEVFDQRHQAWYEMHSDPSPDGLALRFRDISGSRAAHERLRLLESCVEHINDIIIVADAGDGAGMGQRIIYVNDAFVRLTGYSREEAVGRSPIFLHANDADPRELLRIDQALREGRPAKAELLSRVRDGREAWLEVHMTPVADARGRYSHWVAVERDVSERRRTVQALREQATLLDNARDMIVVQGMDRHIRYWNSAAERVYGWPRDQVLDRRADELLFGVDAAVGEEAWITVLERGEWSGRMQQTRRRGTPITVEAHWSLLRDQQGEPSAVLTISTDISERVDLEQRLAQSQKLEAIGQLTGGIAHDFNNLLTVIIGNSELLSELLVDRPELAELATLVREAGESGAELTNRLLAFARRQALEPKIVRPDHLVSGMRPLLERTLGENIAFRLDTDPNIWNVAIDPAQFESAILNLSINARDAMPEGGQLRIRVGNIVLDEEYSDQNVDVEPGAYVIVTVSDTGSGMSPQVIERAFDPFFTTKGKHQGTGLGLSMVYGFVRQSGGHIKLHSELGVGTEVCLYLPCTELLGNAPMILRDTLTGEPGGSERILVVEDDEAVRAHACRVLQDLGYAVVMARDGNEALSLLEHERGVDLLFTDVIMPGGIDGAQLAAEARLSHPDLPVLFTSGYTDNAIVHDGRVDSGVQLLHKPYRRQTLARKIRQVLDASMQSDGRAES